MENKVLGAIGEALIDFIPDKKECDFDEVTGFSPAVGGAPANVCGAFAKLEGKNGAGRLFTQLGNDPFGHKIDNYLKKRNIDTDYVSFTDKANTALAFVSLGKNGDRTFSFYRKPSADMLYSAEQLKEEGFKDLYALHFCSVSLGDFPMKEAHRAAINMAKKEGAIVSFDPNLRFMLWDNKEELKSVVNEFMPLSDIVKISDEELKFITDCNDIEDAIPKIFQGNVKMLVYTCGKDGAWIYLNNEEKTKAYAKSQKVNAVDTTGAGDGFIGSLLWKLYKDNVTVDSLNKISERKLEEYLEFSGKFCGISVTQKGAIDSYPSLEEMEN